jgi:tetratricopeptide (TPR) repeat protein
LERGIAATPDFVPALGRAALILAASGDAGVRDGAKAVRYGERAKALTQGRDPQTLASLAAAYAETGQFDQAIATTRAALEITASGTGANLTQVLQSYLALFEARRPVRITRW